MLHSFIPFTALIYQTLLIFYISFLSLVTSNISIIPLSSVPQAHVAVIYRSRVIAGHLLQVPWPQAEPTYNSERSYFLNCPSYQFGPTFCQPPLAEYLLY